VGRIAGPHGLKGHVKVDPMTDFLARFQAGSRLRLKGEWVEIETSSLHKGRPLLKLSGIDDATAAEAMQFEYLEAPADERPPLEADEYLIEDLIGLRVVTEEGRELGTVDEVHAYPAQDILQVGDIMIPAVEQFVKRVDLETREVVVQLIPGMLPEDD
jgi:16S rRNA processing protein RimM